MHHGWDFVLKGDANSSKQHFQNSINYLEEGQNISFLVTVQIGLGSAYWLLDDLEAARKHMEKGIKVQTDAGVDYDLGFFYSHTAMVDLDSGDLKKAQQRAEEALQIAQKNHQHGEGGVLIVLGRIFGKSDPPLTEKAEEFFLRGIKILKELKLKIYYVPGYYYLGELYADTDQKEKAVETLKKAARTFREMEMDYWLEKTQKLLERL